MPAPRSLHPSRQDTSGCRYNPRDRAAACAGLRVVAQGNEAALEQAVAAVGPVSVAVDASGFQFHFYKSGIVSRILGMGEARGELLSPSGAPEGWDPSPGEGRIRAGPGSPQLCSSQASSAACPARSG